MHALAPRPIARPEFERFRAWLHGVAGISLSDAKQALVSSRLTRRLQALRVPTFGAYFDLLMQGDMRDELQTALDLLTTNETYFFREPRHFDFLRERIVPERRRDASLRLWSAAASSGEEAYSLAMTLAECAPERPWEIVGTDISTRVLAAARLGVYPMERARHIPPALLARHCLRGTGGQAGRFLIHRDLRARVRFEQVNLNAALPRLGGFDAIFLRNVMIYFDPPTKRRVVERLLTHLKPGGFLIVGHTESLNGVSDALRAVQPSVYRAH